MPELYEQLEYADAPGRIRILEVAIKIAKPSSLLVAILEEAGGDKDPTVRRAVAFRAGGFPSLAEDTVPLLRTLLYDRDSSVRSAALTSLGEYPPSTEPLTFEEIAELAIDPDLAVAANAAGIAVRRADPRLQALSLRALPRLVEGLSSTSATDRATAAFAIGQYGRRSEGVIRPLAALIRDTEVPEVRLQAAIALVRIGTLPARKAAIPVLESFVESPDPKLRNAALVTLRAASKK
jgi:HEAT repeat protein